jgi:hypothetical protein
MTLLERKLKNGISVNTLLYAPNPANSVGKNLGGKEMASQLYLKEVETIQTKGPSITTQMARQRAVLMVFLTNPFELYKDTPPDLVLKIRFEVLELDNGNDQNQSKKHKS